MPVVIDIKYALRLLFKAPKFTAMTLSVLVGGLTISLFTFSFLYSTLYKSLPLPEGDTALSFSTETVGISNNIDPNQIEDIAICTVVPHLLYTLRGSCTKYFSKIPFAI